MPRLCEMLFIILFVVFFIIPVIKDVAKVVYKKLKKEVIDVEDFIEHEVKENKENK